MAVRKRLGHFQGVDESVELEMFHLTRERLTALGLAPYEVSNYARAGQECLHNLGYWTGESYIGLGPSAASHVSGWRWKNRAHLGEWEAAVAAGALPARDVENLTPAQRARELAMLLLRLARGLNFADFAARTGFDARETFSDVISNLSRASLIHVDGESLRLIGRGWDLADAVAGEFLATPE
jgi:oxygen-independent coproporphyrinogen-3 oxidase